MKSVRERTFKLTMSTIAAEAFDWLRMKTSADTDSDVIRNALRVHYVLLQAMEHGDRFFVRKGRDQSIALIDLFVVEKKSKK